jgi:hypothetical protein
VEEPQGLTSFPPSCPFAQRGRELTLIGSDDTDQAGSPIEGIFLDHKSSGVWAEAIDPAHHGAAVQAGVVGGFNVQITNRLRFF